MQSEEQCQSGFDWICCTNPEWILFCSCMWSVLIVYSIMALRWRLFAEQTFSIWPNSHSLAVDLRCVAAVSMNISVIHCCWKLFVLYFHIHCVTWASLRLLPCVCVCVLALRLLPDCEHDIEYTLSISECEREVVSKLSKCMTVLCNFTHIFMGHIDHVSLVWWQCHAVGYFWFFFFAAAA